MEGVQAIIIRVVIFLAIAQLSHTAPQDGRNIAASKELEERVSSPPMNEGEKSDAQFHSVEKRHSQVFDVPPMFLQNCNKIYNLDIGDSAVFFSEDGIDRKRCRYRFKSPPGTRLAVQCPQFKLPLGCKREKIIFNQKNYTKMEFCGSKRPKAVISSGNELSVVYFRKSLKIKKTLRKSRVQPTHFACTTQVLGGLPTQTTTWAPPATAKPPPPPTTTTTPTPPTTTTTSITKKRTPTTPTTTPTTTTTTTTTTATTITTTTTKTTTTATTTTTETTTTATTSTLPTTKPTSTTHLSTLSSTTTSSSKTPDQDAPSGWFQKEGEYPGWYHEDMGQFPNWVPGESNIAPAPGWFHHNGENPGWYYQGWGKQNWTGTDQTLPAWNWNNPWFSSQSSSTTLQSTTTNTQEESSPNGYWVVVTGTPGLQSNPTTLQSTRSNGQEVSSPDEESSLMPSEMQT